MCVRVYQILYNNSSMAGRCWSGGERCQSRKMPTPYCSQYFVQLKTFRAVGGTISGGRVVANLCIAEVNGNEW